MKKLIAILLLALCSLALATPGEPAVPTADNVTIADSVVIDSAVYYDSLAARLQLEGDSLMSEAKSNIGFGVVMALLGGAGTIWCAGAGASLEGGAGAIVILMPSACILVGGVLAIFEGIGLGATSDMRIRKAEEYRNTAGRYRTKPQQVKVDFVPLVDPFNKAVGARLAMSL